MAKKQFKAESKRLLDLMINSIYTHKEIFLREIISNASDAIDKLCYISLTDDKVGLSRSDFKILITADKEKRTLTVSDNGIGMTKEDMENNLGVIAKSGSFQFKSEHAEETKNDNIDIIGQFGVGFYSAFMVSDKVTVISKAYGTDTAFCWESEGADGYTVTETEKESFGTEIIMHIKPDTDEEKFGEFLESYKIRSLIKKYSDYIRYPIMTEVEKTKSVETDEKDENGNNKTKYESYTEIETVNSMIPIWQKKKSEVSDETANDFYKEHFYDSENPLRIIRVDAEGAVSYKAMLFIPSKAPYDYFTKDYEKGLKLYANGVMIMEKSADLLSEHFRFVRGVVDSENLSLNISRELLQHDRQLKTIAANLEKKIKSELKKMMTDDPENYEKFFAAFGLQLKYGIVNDYGMHKDTLKDLLLFHSSTLNKLTSLTEYVKRMPSEKKYIYFAAGESVKMVDALPQTEELKDRGFEMLYMTDEVDEFAIGMLGEYEGKQFKSINDSDLGLETETEKKEAEKKSEENKDLLDAIKESLGESVSNVIISHKLKSHPVCLSTEGPITLEMEKYFASIPGGAEAPKASRVLELNPSHRVFGALKDAFNKGEKEKIKKYSYILYNEALLIAGIKIDDPSALAEAIAELMI